MAQPCGASKTTSLSTYTRPPSARSPRSRSSAATCMPRRYGGSTKTTSKRARAPRANSNASPRTTVRFAAPSFCAFSRSARSAAGCFSTMTTDAAPRESASKPSAPLPANRSRHAMPVSSRPSQLNSVSRTRSGVGLKSAASGNSMRRLRHRPPMIRTVLGLVLRTDDDYRELFGSYAPRKGALDLRDGHPFNARGKLVEPVERQPVETDRGDLLEDLAVGVDAQRKAADEALFRRLQLRLGGPGLHELDDDRARQLERFARLVAPRLQSHQKRSLAFVGPEVTVGAVRVAALLAYFPEEPRHESPASQRVIADEERKVVRVGSGERRNAQQHVALGGRVRHAQRRTRGRRDRRQRRIGPFRKTRG